MFRDTFFKPNRIDLYGSSYDFAIHLSNMDSDNKMNTAIFSLNHISSIKLRIYGKFQYYNDNGYVEYMMFLDKNQYIEFRCINNFMTSDMPFGLNITTDAKSGRAKIFITYIGDSHTDGNAQVFRFVFSDCGTFYSDVKYIGVEHKDITRSNFRFLLYPGDRILKHNFNDDDAYYIKNINNTNIQDKILVSGYVNMFMSNHSIAIPKKYANIMIVGGITDDSNTAVMNNDYAYHDVGYLHIKFPISVGYEGILYIKMSKILQLNDTDTYYVNDSVHKLVTYDYKIICDYIDDFYYYFHISQTCTGDSSIDNWIKIIGNFYTKNAYNLPISTSSAVASLIPEKKKLQNNLQNKQNNSYKIYKLCYSKHNFYSSFLYKLRGVDKCVYNVA